MLISFCTVADKLPKLVVFWGLYPSLIGLIFRLAMFGPFTVKKKYPLTEITISRALHSYCNVVQVNTPAMQYKFENLNQLLVSVKGVIIYCTTTHIYLPMKMEQTECSKTSAYKIQTPGNYPKESIQHTEHGESFKSRIYCTVHHSIFSLLNSTGITQINRKSCSQMQQMWKLFHRLLHVTSCFIKLHNLLHIKHNNEVCFFFGFWYSLWYEIYFQLWNFEESVLTKNDWKKWKTS